VTVPTYPGYPVPEPRRRPTTVTVASYLLYVVSAVEVVTAILTLSNYSRTYDAIKAAYAGTAAEGAEGVVAGFSVGGAVLNILLAIGFATLGYLDGRGKNPARVVTWVIGGISLCCVGIGLGGTAYFSAMGSSSSSVPGGPSQAEIQQRIDAALPSWYRPFSVVLALITLAAMLLVIILLALPASNAFFRKQPAGFDPNLVYPPYPGGQYPGYGQQPYPSPPQPGPFGQPGQPAPGLPPYPGQPTPPPASDPFAAPPPPPPGPQAPGTPGDQPPKSPTDPA
jgi:hypothetical protein